VKETVLALLIIAVLFAIWIAFGLVGSTMMKNRGRSETAGGLPGLFPGPLGLLIILLVSDSAEKIAGQRQSVAVNMPVQDLSNIDLPGAARAS
jgi:hypothetical protein